ncbi:signal peptidase I [Micromonospora sp. WMMD1102]|uniref:signal peptidase I n=1 Tax=Micromonospora sp. WMMD1102 TaxID=3016105 RepID=UPI00241525C9|nr:signal peptidase I [Micromonospora sp. WMMD1102]MDG4785582.1 signal peptidase I [Micromonospora sp. WMMD1102]
MPLWQELPLLLIVAFCLAVLIRTFLLQAFYIPSGSMEDTLLIGDRVLVNKIVYDVRDPVRGEIVVFRGTAAWAPEVREEADPGFVAKLGRTVGDLVGVSRPGEKDFIKRVVGLPGDRVLCCDDQGRVTVNGTPIDEPYVLENSPLDVPPNRQECRSRRFDEVVVPPDQIFVMGDHRLVSQDARCQGPVPIENVIGRAFVVVWPFANWSSLPVPDTFDELPRPAAAPAPGGSPADTGRPSPADDPQHSPADNPQHSPADNPQNGPDTGETAIAMPILGSLLVTARSRRFRRTRHRRLHP